MNKEIKGARERIEEKRSYYASILDDLWGERHATNTRYYLEVRSRITHAISELKSLRTINTALESYKPKTVSREWAWDLIKAVDDTRSRHPVFVRVCNKLKEKGIEVEGDK